MAVPARSAGRGRLPVGVVVAALCGDDDRCHAALGASMLKASCRIGSFLAAQRLPPAFGIGERGSIGSKSFPPYGLSIPSRPLPRQPDQTYCLLISTPFRLRNSTDQTVLPQLIWPGEGAPDSTRLDQPYRECVVLVVIARTATPARAAVAVFKGERAGGKRLRRF